MVNQLKKFKDKEKRMLLKGLLKEGRLSIIKKRTELKQAQRSNAEHYALQSTLLQHVIDYRHLHIAYSLLCGNSYDMIERSVKEGNEPIWYDINKIINSYGEEL